MYVAIASGPIVCAIVCKNCPSACTSCPLPNELIPATMIGFTIPLGIRGISPVFWNTLSFLFKYGTKNSTVRSPKALQAVALVPSVSYVPLQLWSFLTVLLTESGTLRSTASRVSACAAMP